ncbi:MAG: hypothetical protein EOO88_49535 [Pedobacter sp.]|nr:MAG: hypothetical protein EOO88_49535 [Pedobacter sp.]
MLAINQIKTATLCRLALFMLFMMGFKQIASSQAVYDNLRLKWRNFLVSYSSPSSYDTSNVGSYWRNMKKNSDRTYLWSEWNFSPSDPNSGEITNSYARLNSMALAWAIPSSPLYHNYLLKTDIIGAMEWLYQNHYNINVTHPDHDSNATLNWWDYQIGTPLEINDLVTIFYDSMTTTQKSNYLDVVHHFTPDFKQRYSSEDSNSVFTMANRVWVSSVIALRGILVKDSTRIRYASDSLASVFTYASSKDGFYQDGSFIQHQQFAYTGGYGASLMSILADELYLLKGSVFQVNHPNVVNVYKWVYDSFAPIMYRGGLMSMTMGREISWPVHEEIKQGRRLTEAVSLLADIAPISDTLKLRRIVKRWALDQGNPGKYSNRYQPFINKALNYSTIKPDSSYETSYDQFSGMDRALQRHPKYALLGYQCWVWLDRQTQRHA